MNSEIWFFFTPDGKHEITVLDKESAQSVAMLMSHEQKRQWKCRRNRSQDTWFVHECTDLVGHAEVKPEPRHNNLHSEIPKHHAVSSNEEVMGAPLADPHWSQPAPQAWQPPNQSQPHVTQAMPPLPTQAWQPPQAPHPQQQVPQHQWQQPQQAWQPPQAQPQYQAPPMPQQPPQQQWKPQHQAQPPVQHQQPWTPPQAAVEAPVAQPPSGPREKRRHQRIGLRLRVVLIAGNRSFRTYSRDVSKGGMSFEHIVPKELIGQNCKVIIGSADMKENLEFEAAIAGDPNNPRAVEFHEAKDHFMRKLEGWLNDAKKTAA